MEIHVVKRSIGLMFIALLLFVILYYGYQYKLLVETSNAVAVKFVGFQWGDYQHAVFETNQGEIIDVFTSGEGCFLALNRSEALLVNFSQEETYILEAGGYIVIPVAKSIRVVNSNRLWVSDFRFTNEDYDQHERKSCNKIQAEFIYSESTQ